jgi:hypothetical protein
MTLYALALVSNRPWIPKRPGTWDETIVMAEPVMKPATAGVGINSTIQPMRKRPIPRTIKPHMKARVMAICTLSHSSPCDFWMYLMMLATSRDMTATGPIDTSLDVAKNYLGEKERRLARFSCLKITREVRTQ